MPHDKKKHIKYAITPLMESPNETVNVRDIQLSLDGRKQAVLEGAMGITEYNSNSIKLSTKKCLVHFEGVNLQISTMSYSFAVIKGKINSISFIDN